MPTFIYHHFIFPFVDWPKSLNILTVLCHLQKVCCQTVQLKLAQFAYPHYGTRSSHIELLEIYWALKIDLRPVRSNIRKIMPVSSSACPLKTKYADILKSSGSGDKGLEMKTAIVLTVQWAVYIMHFPTKADHPEHSNHLFLNIHFNHSQNQY